MWKDINEKENKIWYINHRLEVLSKVSELKLNDINSQITSIHTGLDNIASSHKAKSVCSRIISNHYIEEIKSLREELKNKSTINNILLENIFSYNKHFSSYKKMKDNYLKKPLKILILNSKKILS